MGYPFPAWRPGEGEHKFIWVQNGGEKILLHAFREHNGKEWRLANGLDSALGITPRGAMYQLSMVARKATWLERFRYWLYTKEWTDEAV